MLAVAAAALVGGLTAGEGAGAVGGPSSLGVYVGYQAPSLVSTLGRTLGDQPTFAMDFLDGDSWSALVNSAPSYMAAWKNSGDTMIWGIPMLPNASSSGGASGPSLGQGAAGAYNSYFLTLAQDMVAGGQANSIIRPGWEFNGGWYSWAANGQAAAFIGYWQQIVTTMRSVPGQNFTFEWNPTAGDQGIGNLANYYPGNAYVDYIGLDLYDQAWGNYPGISSQWNTYLTEPYGLNWLASFAATQGKQITLPEWGLGEGPGNDGGPVSNPGNNVSGGDDPTFINDMAQWISTHNVYDATFWDYGSSLSEHAFQPAQPHRLRGGLRYRTGRLRDRPATVNDHHDGSSDHHDDDTWKRHIGLRDADDDHDDDHRPTDQDVAHVGRRGLDIDLGHVVTAVGRLGLPGHERHRLVGVVPARAGPVGHLPGRPIHRRDRNDPSVEAASIGRGHVEHRQPVRRFGSVPLGQQRRLEHDGADLLHSGTGCSARRRRSVHRLRELPRRARRHVLLRHDHAGCRQGELAGRGSGEPRSTAGRRRRDHGDRARLSGDRRDAHGHRDVRRLGPIGGVVAVCRWERGRAHIGHGVVCRPAVGDTGHAGRRHRHLRRRRFVRREHLEPVGLHGRVTPALVGEPQFERSLPGEEHGGRRDDAGGDRERPGRPGVQHQDGSDERSDEHGDDGRRAEACMRIGAAR